MTTRTCAYHARREATSSCVACGKPLCRDCMRQTAVGFKCVDCTGRAPEDKAQIRSRRWRWVGGVAVVGLVVLGVVALMGGDEPGTPEVDPVAQPRQLEVSFEGAGGFEISAVVDAPGGGGTYPAVAIIPGLGATTRDGVVVEGGEVDPLYRDLADTLVSEGFLVLRYDRRGTGENSDAGEVTFEQETEDAIRAVAHLRERSDVIPSAVGLIGHGGGGFVGLRIADHALDVDALALINTPGRPLGDVLVGEYMSLDENHQEAGREVDRAIEVLIQTGEIPEIENSMARPVFTIGSPRYLRELFSFDPTDAATRVVAPTLLVHGEAHTSVLDSDVEALEESLTAAPDVETMHVVGVADTLARDPSEAGVPASPAPGATEHGGQPHDMGGGNVGPRDTQALRNIADWLSVHVREGGAGSDQPGSDEPQPSPSPPGAVGWSEMAPSPLEARTASAAGWSGEEFIVWGGAVCSGECDAETARPVGDGAAYDPDTDSWRPVAESPLTPRFDTTGPRRPWPGFMFIWGGDDGTGFVADGAIYDPPSDSWRPVAPSPLSPRSAASSAWTGGEVLVWGGTGPDGRLADGAAYDPAADTWRTMAPSPLGPRVGAVTAWTGDEFVVWGGTSAGAAEEVHGDGAAYDPATDTWRPLAESPLTPRQPFRTAWTGDELLVLGGEAGEQIFTDGAAYDPEADTWRPLSSSPVVTRRGATSLWSGDELVVGGGIADGEQRTDGAAYDVESDSWRTIDRWLAPINVTSAWTGDEFLLWGGLVQGPGGGFETVGNGQRFDPGA